MFNRIVFFILITVTAIFVAPLSPYTIRSEEKTTIAVMDLEGSLTPDELQILSEALRQQLFETKKYVIVNRQKMNQIMEEHKFSQTGFTDSTKISEVGKALGAKKIIYGRIGKFGKTYQLSLTLVDMETTKEENRISEQWSFDDKDLILSLIIPIAAYKIVCYTANENETITELSTALEEYVDNVESKDIDRNGINDIVLHSKNNLQEDDLVIFMTQATLMMGVVADFLSWKPDKIYIINGDVKIFTTLSKCKKCFESFKNSGNWEEVGQCIADSWTKEARVNWPTTTTTPTSAPAATISKYSSMRLGTRDLCNDNKAIQLSFFDTTNGGGWPGGDEVYLVQQFNKAYTVDIKCVTGSKICYGAESGNYKWGLGINKEKSCQSCCVTCEEGVSKIWDLGCN